MAGEKSHKTQLVEELLMRLVDSPEMSPLIGYLISNVQPLRYIYIVTTQMESLRHEEVMGGSRGTLQE